MINLLAIFGLAFLFKDSSGPFGILSKLRNKLFTNKYVGVFFYNLLSCYFCTGFHCGWIVYLISCKEVNFSEMVLYSLAGGTICLICSKVLDEDRSH